MKAFKLLAIDGNSIVNRAFYGIRMLNAPDGTPTNGIYGFITILQRLIDEEKPDGLCVAFDLRAPTFRHLQYEGYKAQRKGMPEELALQMPILKEVLDAMGIMRIEKEGFEADDLLGTLSRICEKDGDECVIVTGDKDSFQLITDETRVLHVKSRMGQTETINYTRSRFEEEYGFEPIKMIDLKAFMGDSSDNIPGVAGVGEKTALDLIRRFESIDNIYANIDTIDIKDGVRKKLIAGEDSARMSYELATIVTEAPVEIAPRSAAWSTESFKPELYNLFLRLGFTKFIEKYKIRPAAGASPRPTGTHIVGASVGAIHESPANGKRDNPSVGGADSSLYTREPLDDVPQNEVFEAECTIEHITTAAQIAAALAGAGEETVYFVFEDGLDYIVFQYDCKAFVLDRFAFTGNYTEALNTLFTSPVKKAGHHIKDSLRALLALGIESENWVFDSALAAYLLDSTAGSYDISRLCVRYCGFEPWTGDEEESGQMSLLDVPDDTKRAARLASLGAAVGCLEEKMLPLLRENDMEKLYFEIELPLCGVLADMENEGFLVDKAALRAFGESMTEGIEALQKSIWEAAGEEFNINSPKQLGTVLFDKLMLPHGKKTKTGWSTNADILEKLRDKHPIINEILEYRTLTKLKSTYADGLLKVIAPDGRIHTSFQMTVTATGRLSSTEPNLQNIPIRKAQGAQIRRMFVAGEGKVLVDADYSQIELRLLAHISGDENMMGAFRSGEDVHRFTASQVFGVPISEVTAQQRSAAKAVNFGIVYGISAWSLAQDIGVSPAEAKAYMDAYLDNYSGVRTYQKNIVEQAKAEGLVKTLYGRQRALPELKSSNFAMRSFGERVALNMPIQGTAADLIKIAMVNVHRRLKAEGLEAKLILQVHDELIVEATEQEAEKVAAILREEMEKAGSFHVPLTAEAKLGKSWAEAH